MKALNRFATSDFRRALALALTHRDETNHAPFTAREGYFYCPDCEFVVCTYPEEQEIEKLVAAEYDHCYDKMEAAIDGLRNLL